MMPITLETVVAKYLRPGNPAQRTREEYSTTLKKWKRWGDGVSLEKLGRKEIREFLDWVYEDAAAQQGRNPGRTANKVRSHLRAVMSWAWEQDIVDAPPRFPKLKPQRDVAGRHYLTKGEINAIYFATHQMKRPRGWSCPYPVDRYWRCALVAFFNYGVDTSTVWKTASFHEPIRWRHAFWDRQSPDRQVKEQSPWGWLFYRRVKTGKTFYRPMNRTWHAHIKSVMRENPDPDAPVFLGGGTRPNKRFRALCRLASTGPKTNEETGEEQPWVLADLRKTCATYYDEHVPESSVEILGHSAGG
jgi:integrase family protein with SAM-like domain